MNYLEKVNSPDDIKNLKVNELKVLAQEIRDKIIKTVSNNGGHLASNLGVVELTIALHLALDCPEDKLVWDVSHQSYTHKLLTGRYGSFHTLRQYKGLSGYTNINESIYDAFGAGHSSTSISAALGMAVKRDLKKEDNKVVAVIGDGALTSGMAWEALNHVGHLGKKMVVILNDNQMSISQNVGALAEYLSLLRTDPGYNNAKTNIKELLDDIPIVGSGLKSTVSRFKNSLKYLLVKGLIFEEFGFTYMGPIDGHNIESTKKTLEQAFKIDKPVIIHCITKKGYGYNPALTSPEIYHGISPFVVETGKVKSINKKSFSTIFGETMMELAKNNEDIVAITAAMCTGVGLDRFKVKYPNRFFDTGITEQHATTLAAGMAVSGLRPYFAVYSTFLQRAYDQVIHDIALQNLPVTLAIDRAGLVGADGATHHGSFDLSYLKSVPNLTIMAPSNGKELEKMLKFSSKLDGPSAIRYPRAKADLLTKSIDTKIEIGKADLLIEGSHVLLWAIGKMTSIAVQVAKNLEKIGVKASVVDSRFLKPFDKELLIDLVKGKYLLVSLEDNSIIGGLGDTISQIMVDENLEIELLKIGIPDNFITHGSLEQLYKEIGMDVDSITINIINKLKRYNLTIKQGNTSYIGN